MATNNLKTVLGNENLTQIQLSTESGIGTGTISKVCSKTTTPAPKTKATLVDALNRLAKNTYTLTDIFP